MVFAAHWRVVMSGRIGNPQADRFSMGINLGGPVVEGEKSTLFPDIVADCVAYFARPTTNISVNSVLDMVKISEILPGPRPGVAGSSAPGHVNGEPFIGVVNTPGGRAAIPGETPQTALAVSLNTARYGPTGKGRFYLPVLSMYTAANNGFRIDSGDALAIAQSTDTFLEALNNMPGADIGSNLNVVVASTKGYNTPVTGVRVGRVLDTIRTRRNKIAEIYSPVQPVA